MDYTFPEDERNIHVHSGYIDAINNMLKVTKPEDQGMITLWIQLLFGKNRLLMIG